MCKKMICGFITIFILLTGALNFAFAQQDVEGSEDHPMISRYEGSYIRGYEKYDYDRLTFYTGEEDGELQMIVPEGEVTRILYFQPEGATVLQVQRNYQQALINAGFELVYECFGGMDQIPRSIFTDFETIGGRETRNVFMGSDHSYFMARLKRESGDVFVSAHSARSDQADEDNQVVTALQIMEEKPMETGKVKVDLSADAMAEQIDELGSVRIYGIHFDTGEATIEEGSESALAEIASFLKENPGISIGVIGHTSSTGGIELNMELSEERAKAVVDYLVNEHGIDKGRLIPKGVGPFAPVASNRDEEGRARNRRVELIEL